MNFKEKILDFFMITLGTAIVAFAVFFFMMPSKVSVGSIAALAMVLNNFVPVPVSMLTLSMNIILLTLGFIFIGKEFGIKTVYTATLMPIMMRGFEILYQISPSEKGAKLTSTDVNDTYRTMLRRIDKLGVTEPELTIEGKDKIRVKLAGVYMDIPVANVEVKEYSSSANVSYYMGTDGMLFHYYYTGSYGSTSKRESTLVGYTPDYLKDGVKYYSYDGHYFYTDYKKMLTDYKSGVNTYTNAINKNNPYYNYYQYLSFRVPTTLTKTQINKYISKYTGPSTSRPNSKLYNQAEALLDNEKTYGVNVGLMLGIAINESGWGNSKYAVNYNNFFGLNVTDDGNSVAYSFDTPEECFNYFSSVVISKGYMYGGDSRYRGPHLGDKQSGVNVCYASDPYWGEKAAAFSYYMDMNAMVGPYSL